MAGTIQKFASALGLALLATVTPPLAAVAVAQNVPIGLDLNGVWELEEHGQRQDPALPLVQITHSGNQVLAKFLTGSKCFNGEDRVHVFDARLVGQPTVPPIWRLTSDDMWVCSGSPSVVQKCGMSSKYQTAFTNAIVDPNLIRGTRFRHVVDGCASTRESRASGNFMLRRLEPCELEQRHYDREVAESELLWRRIIAQREIFTRAGQAAQRRYSGTFNGHPTTLLTIPSDNLLRADLSGATELEAFFVAMQEYSQHPDWAAARAMAAAMAADANPLPAAAAMVAEMDRIEGFIPEVREQLTHLRDARRALDKCLKAP